MTKKEYRELYDEEDAVGWLVIDEKIEEIYPDQAPRHYAPSLYYALGGQDPLDGVSIYDSQKGEFHRHIISYGMSELYYNEEAVGGEFSKWGFEFTFRLKPFEEDDEDPVWVIEVMNNLARYVYESELWFEEYHFVPAKGPIRTETKNPVDIVGIVFVLDPELGKISTPHGEVSFLQMVGITSQELDRLTNDPQISNVKDLIEEMRKSNPFLITDLTRK